MVSKINKNFHEYKEDDYKNIAWALVNYYSKKYNCNIDLSFTAVSPHLVGYTVSSSSRNVTPTKDNTSFTIMLNLSADDFNEVKNKEEYLFTLLMTIFHEIYHVKSTLCSLNSNCFNLEALFSALNEETDDFGDVWYQNYFIIDEEIKASQFGIKQAFNFIKKYYHDTFYLASLIPFLQERKKLYQTYHFYHKYSFQNKLISKEQAFIELTKQFSSLNKEYYPEILNKVYNKEQKRMKTTKELINDYNKYIKMYDDIKKKREINKFYSILISELSMDMETKDANLDYFRQYRRQYEINKFKAIKSVKTPPSLILKKQKFLKEQYDNIEKLHDYK